MENTSISTDKLSSETVRYLKCCDHGIGRRGSRQLLREASRNTFVIACSDPLALTFQSAVNSIVVAETHNTHARTFVESVKQSNVSSKTFLKLES